MRHLWKDERLLKAKETKNTTKMDRYKILDKKNLIDVTGGSEFSEAVFRLAGYLSVKIEDAWADWCENCSFNAGMAKC